MKKILFTLLMFIAVNAISQNIPTLYSYTVDTLCEGDYQKQFVSITLLDIDGDSTYIDVVTYNNAVLDVNGGYTVNNPPFVPGDTLRTITVIGDANWGLANGINLASVNFEIYGHPTNDPSGGANDFDINDIPVYGPLTSILTTGNVTFCTNDNPVDLSQYEVYSGGDFSWEGGLYNYNETSYFDPELALPVYDYNGGEYAISYDYTNSAGCSYSSEIWVSYIQSPVINVTPTPSSCGNADGSAVAILTGGQAPYDVYWSTGFAESASSASTIANVPAGNYYINVTDGTGCHAVAAAHVSDAEITVTPTINPSYCSTQNGSVDLVINSTMGTVNQIFWSNGNTTANLSAQPGDYTVLIKTDAGCKYVNSFNIPNEQLALSIYDVWGNSNCLTTPNGAIDITTIGGQSPVTWSWTKNGSPFSTLEDLNAISGGIYVCTATDANSCVATLTQTVQNYNNVYLWADNITPTSCGANNGAIDIYIDTWGEIPASYSWNTGATTEDLTGVGAGTYTLTYTDQSGCENYLTVNIPYVLPYQPEICMLTVDTTYTYNLVVWEKLAGNTPDGFNVYRETETFGTFEQVHSQPFATESFFIDNSASPIDRSWRYYITSYDNCGNESYPSFIHKTIHIVSSSAGGGSYNVSWDKYEGLNYTSVDLYRHSNSNGWQFVNNFSTTQLSTVDTPTDTAGLDYIVSFNLASACTSSKAQDYNSSRSNTTSSVWSPGEDVLTIKDLDLGTIMVYPNPTSGSVTVFIENPEMFERIELKNVNGQLLSSNMILGAYSTVSLEDFTDGMYFISLVSNDQVIVRKIIKK
ncbi:MAG: T9SS type A sorting domain-containing protein [Crocinitomicaceae bacterium]|nr:T9SS type A sorting domain-containing protein [Crocinitomicaceae bacterium]